MFKQHKSSSHQIEIQQISKNLQNWNSVNSFFFKSSRHDVTPTVTLQGTARCEALDLSNCSEVRFCTSVWFAKKNSEQKFSIWTKNRRKISFRKFVVLCLCCFCVFSLLQALPFCSLHFLPFGSWTSRWWSRWFVPADSASLRTPGSNWRDLWGGMFFFRKKIDNFILK